MQDSREECMFDLCLASNMFNPISSVYGLQSMAWQRRMWVWARKATQSIERGELEKNM